jgi:hypothetical protein
MLRNLILLILNTWVAQLDNPCKTKWWYMLSPPQRLLKNMKFEGIEIALEGIWYEIRGNWIPSNFIFFKSLCGGESIHCMFITYLDESDVNLTDLKCIDVYAVLHAVLEWENDTKLHVFATKHKANT